MGTKKSRFEVAEVGDSHPATLMTTVIQQGANLKALNSKFNDIEVTLGHFSEKIDHLASAVQALSSRPNLSLISLLDASLKAGALMGVVIGGIVYVTQASFSSQLSSLEERITARSKITEAIEQKLEVLDVEKWSKTQQAFWCAANKAIYTKLVCQ